MAFITYKYELLITNILQLQKSYSNLIGRYSITDSVHDNPSPSSKNTLELLIGRTNDYVIQCDTERKTQRDVFSKLTSELRPFIKGTADEIKNASLCLLGALIHRYYRLITEYKDYNKSRYNILSFFKYDIRDINKCRLYQAIEAALQLDKQALDEYTVVNALQVFRENMFLEVDADEPEGKTKKKIKQTRYKFYLHFAKEDPNFKIHLDEMIVMHQKLGATLMKQFQAISLMQSLVTQLEKDHEPIVKQINSWVKNLGKTHKNFSTLTQESITTHLDHYYNSKIDNPMIKKKILEIISIGYESKRFQDSKDYASFLEAVHASNTDESRCILYGGYVLLLLCGGLEKDLLTLMVKCLGLQTDLSIRDQLDCIDLLKLYIEKETTFINCEFFASRSNMVTQVSKLWVSLEQEIREANSATL